MNDLERLLQKEWLRLAQDITLLFAETNKGRINGRYKVACRRLERVKRYKDQILERERNNNDI